MVYRLSLAVDENVCLEVEHATFAEILDEFKNLGGDPVWLENSARAAVVASRAGDAARIAVRALGGHLLDPKAPGPIPETPENGTAVAPSAPVTASAIAGSVKPGPRPPADPWSTTPEIESPAPVADTWPGEAAVVRDALSSSKPQVADPWNDEEWPQGGPQPEVTNPSIPLNVKRDRFGREFTLDAPGAPNCDCGQLAIKMKARAKNTGNIYEAWVCAKGITDNWAGKCKFLQFLD